MNPHISIIVPALNEEKLIKKAIESLEGQTYPRNLYEIIVVDGGSKDHTVSVAKKFNVTILKRNDVGTIAHSRQAGAGHAKGEILAFMDSDSVADRRWLEIIDELFKNTSIVAVSGVAIPATRKRRVKILFSLYNLLLRIHQIFGVVLPWGFNIAVRKDEFRKIGGFNISMETTEDWELGLRMQRKFGRKSVIYSQRLKVYTSTRKHERIQSLLDYIWCGFLNYCSIVLLKKTTVTELRTVR